MKSLSRTLGKNVKKVMNSKYLVLIVLALLIGGYMLYNRCKKGKFELFSGGSTLYFFFADWCGHCKNFKPEWQKLTNMSDLGVQFEEVDCTDSKNVPALATEYNVRGFPTLILVNGGNNATYEGERTANAIASFIKNNQ
jgi:thiol-disulfide isomerase/thioredoxin